MRHRKRIIYHLLCLSLVTSISCVDENIANLSENITVKQDISFPLGPTSITIPDDIINFSSNTPGPYGFFFFNGYQIPLISGKYIFTDLIKFDLGSRDTRLDWIKNCMLRQIIENDFPIPATIQFYTLDESGSITDSVFIQGPNTINAAQVDEKGIIIRKSVQQFDVTFEGARLDHIKKAVHLLVKTSIQIPVSGSPVYLSSANKLLIDLSGRFHLEYNIKELR